MHIYYLLIYFVIYLVLIIPAMDRSIIGSPGFATFYAARFAVEFAGIFADSLAVGIPFSGILRFVIVRGLPLCSWACRFALPVHAVHLVQRLLASKQVCRDPGGDEDPSAQKQRWNRH